MRHSSISQCQPSNDLHPGSYLNSNDVSTGRKRERKKALKVIRMCFCQPYKPWEFPSNQDIYLHLLLKFRCIFLPPTKNLSVHCVFSNLYTLVSLATSHLL